MIAIANPNNPTGTVAHEEDLMRIARAAPDAAVLVDEAYFEFCGQTVLARRREFANLFVARTFSKAYGMAGLRIGVLVGDPDQMRAMRRVSSPYNVNAVALACLPEAIGDQVYIQQYVRKFASHAHAWSALSKERDSLLAEPGEFCAGACGRGGGRLSNACGGAAFWCATDRVIMAAKGVYASRSGHASTPIACSPRWKKRSRNSALHKERPAMRKGSIKRLSKETQIQISLTIEGRGRYQVSTGIRFFDHMLELFAHHGGFDLKLKARGDLDVDQHHTVEDVGIVLGQAFDKALGSKRGILRAGYFLMPMDETMGMAAVDFCGRTAAVIDTKVRTRLVGDLQAELVHDFFEGFARGARANVHARVLYGRSSHHKIEALFKAFARALRAACWRDRRMVRLLPSTKGVL